MLMLWRHFPPSCAVSQSWKIKKYSKFAEDVCPNPLKGIHTHYIATTLLNTGPEALFFFFFWSICINLVENSLPFYCLLIQTLALTDHGKFLFCLSMPPSSCTGDWEECSEQMCCGRKWMKALLRDWYFPREKREKKRKTRQKNLLYRQIKRQAHGILRQKPWMEGKPIQNQEIQVRRALLSSPPNLFKWQNHVQARVCRRVHLCCHKRVSKCGEFPALLLETLSFVS